jgi:ribose transport system permease protein
MTLFHPGTATIVGTFCGALFIGVINNGPNLIGMDTYIQNIVRGLIILVAVAVVSRMKKFGILSQGGKDERSDQGSVCRCG